MSTRGEVQGFLPSTAGLHFSNRFRPGPVLRIGGIPIGNASKGMCGGMVFTVRDAFEGRIPQPKDREAPKEGTSLFRYLARRLFASFDLPGGPLRYMLWMALPEEDLLFGIQGLRSRTLKGEWPKVRADIDQGSPSPLGLIRAHSLNPMDLARNHQVLAYAYSVEDGSSLLSLRVYDPNHPDDDSIRLVVPVDGPITYVPGEEPVRGFFRATYRPPRI